MPSTLATEPGGYIQWDELDCATFHAHAPNTSVSTESSSELLARWQAFCAKSGLDFTFVIPPCFERPVTENSIIRCCSYISSLADIFVSNHLEVIDSFRLPITDNLRRASTDNFIMALEEIGAIASAKNVDLLGTSEDFKALWQRAVTETEKGVSVGMDMVVIVGRKPYTAQRS